MGGGLSRGLRRERAENIRRILDERGGVVGANVRPFNEGRYRRYAEMEGTEAARAEARRIKEEAIERLPELVERVREVVRDRGGRVHLAADAREAREHVRDLVRRTGARSVVKAKSMTTEEIRLNDALREVGAEVYETDLAEFVLEVAGEPPSHIAAPAVHRTRAEIAALFNARFRLDPPLETPEELTRFARKLLLERILRADVGVTGANFITADTGTVVLVTNEGNARKCMVTPRIHVVVAGIEKIVPSLADLSAFLRLIGPAGSGQSVPAYLSLFTPPVASPVVGGGSPETPFSARTGRRAFHLVLVDNGRLGMRDDPVLRETLYCVRCGACANVCANFQQVGGHVFGGETYSGGIATGWEAGVGGLHAAASFNDLCTGCSRCVPACPVKIDIPWINVAVRDRLNRAGESGGTSLFGDRPAPGREAASPGAARLLFGHFGTLARWGSRTAPLSNLLLATPPFRLLLERVAGVDRRRNLPRFRRVTFRDWFRARTGRRERALSAPRGEVVLYADVYTDHVLPERGTAAVRVLEALGFAVRLPAAPESGRAPLSQGMVVTAARQARRVVTALDAHLEAGRDVLVLEPSDLAMFRRDYARLLEKADFERIAARSRDLFEFLDGVLEEGGETGVLACPPRDGAVVVHHAHCQQRTLGLDRHTRRVLERVGYEVHDTDVECCGMAGSFGYRTDFYELSLAVGGELRDRLAAAGRKGWQVTASGTSCREQIETLLRRPCAHPVQLLDPGPGAGTDLPTA